MSRAAPFDLRNGMAEETKNEEGDGEMWVEFWGGTKSLVAGNSSG